MNDSCRKDQIPSQLYSFFFALPPRNSTMILALPQGKINTPRETLRYHAA